MTVPAESTKKKLGDKNVQDLVTTINSIMGGGMPMFGIPGMLGGPIGMPFLGGPASIAPVIGGMLFGQRPQAPSNVIGGGFIPQPNPRVFF